MRYVALGAWRYQEHDLAGLEELSQAGRIGRIERNDHVASRGVASDDVDGVVAHRQYRGDCRVRRPIGCPDRQRPGIEHLQQGPQRRRAAIP